MKQVDYMVAIVGEDSDVSDVLYMGMREFPAKQLILISEDRHKTKVDAIKKDVSKFKIPVSHVRIQNKENIEYVFAKMRMIKETQKNATIMINVDTDYASSCLALSAAFVNGIQAIGILKDQVIAYPIMKFSYYSALSDKKVKLMKILHEHKRFSLDELSKAAKMSLPLISYHIHGNLKSEGLKTLGIIETEELKGRVFVELSTLGKLLVRGYLD